MAFYNVNSSQYSRNYFSKIENMKNFWLGLIILFSAYFVRYIFAFHSGLPFISTDTYNYIEMAKGIIQFNPLSFFPNGYPIIISFFLHCFQSLSY